VPWFASARIDPAETAFVFPVLWVEISETGSYDSERGLGEGLCKVIFGPLKSPLTVLPKQDFGSRRFCDRRADLAHEKGILADSFSHSPVERSSEDKL
jgi:hypothetical protein